MDTLTKIFMEKAEKKLQKMALKYNIFDFKVKFKFNVSKKDVISKIQKPENERIKIGKDSEEFFCHAISVDGIHFVCLPDGTEIPNIQETTIHQGVDDCKHEFVKLATATIKLPVLLKNT
jgi:hypothetical protein